MKITRRTGKTGQTGKIYPVPPYFPSRLTAILRTIGHVSLIVILASVMLAGFLYAILAEQDLRELRYSDGWYRWLHERAIAEHHASRGDTTLFTPYLPSRPSGDRRSP